MRDISCPLKKSWKLRWRKARSVVAHRGAVFTSVASVVAEFCSSVTLSFFHSLELFHIFGMTAREDGVRRDDGEKNPRDFWLLLFTFRIDFHRPGG